MRGLPAAVLSLRCMDMNMDMVMHAWTRGLPATTSSLSCIANARKGAMPVPGPTMMMGVDGFGGKRKAEARTKTTAVEPEKRDRDLTRVDMHARRRRWSSLAAVGVHAQDLPVCACARSAGVHMREIHPPGWRSPSCVEQTPSLSRACVR